MRLNRVTEPLRRVMRLHQLTSAELPHKEYHDLRRIHQGMLTKQHVTIIMTRRHPASLMNRIGCEQLCS